MNVLVQARVDPKVKKEAEEIMKKLGISLNDAIRMFLSQITHSKGLPFKPSLVNEEDYSPNARLRKIINDMHKGVGVKSYESVEEMWKDLDGE